MESDELGDFIGPEGWYHVGRRRRVRPFIESNLAAVRELCRAYGVRRLEVFGSAARDDFEPGRSDIDLLVEFDYASPVDLRGGAGGGGGADRWFGLTRDLEALLGHKVDLVSAHKATNPYFLETVNRDRKVVYAA